LGDIGLTDHADQLAVLRAGESRVNVPKGTWQAMQITWKPLDRPASKRAELPQSAFAFPAERKEPLVDASHVRSAVARFAQVQGVSDGERAQAFANIKAAAAYFGVTVGAKSWHDLAG
jgi:hypothetical protein